MPNMLSFTIITDSDIDNRPILLLKRNYKSDEIVLIGKMDFISISNLELKGFTCFVMKRPYSYERLA